jgi:hypothetical protein
VIQPEQPGIGRVTYRHEHPPAIPDGGIELVAVKYQEPPAIDSDVDSVAMNGNGTECAADVPTQTVVMISGDYNQTHPGVDLAQQALDDSAVFVAPVSGSALKHFEINDVADQKQRLALQPPEKPEQLPGSAMAPAKVQVRQPDGPTMEAG